MFGRTEVNENWKKRHNKELMQLFRDVDNLLSFVSVIGLDWIGRANRTDSKGKANPIFDNKSQESRLTGRPKNRW
jgi:hypothetical protein